MPNIKVECRLMINVYKNKKKETKQKKLLVKEKKEGILPGSFEFPGERRKYDWNPTPEKEQTGRSVPENKSAPIAIF